MWAGLRLVFRSRLRQVTIGTEEVLKQIEPTEDDNTRIEAAVASLRNVLTNNWTNARAVQEIVIGGSYAKNTLLRGHLEVDVVVFLAGEWTREDCLHSFRQSIGQIWKLGQDNVRLTRHSVQFRHPSTGVDVDLLFTFAISAHSGLSVFDDRRQFQTQRTGKRKRSRYLNDFDLLRETSTSVVQDQVRLVRQAQPRVWSLIQLAKALKVRFMDAAATYLPSYVLEILALDYVSQTCAVDFDQGLRHIFEQLRDLDTEFVFHRCSEAARIGISSSAVEGYWRGRREWSQGAVLPDPVNPLHNTATLLKTSELREVCTALLDEVWGD